MLKINDIHVDIGGRPVLKGLSLQIQAGEVHAIMGPNGSGKSTLSKVLAGYPGYDLHRGTITYDINGFYKDLIELQPEERAREGVFLAFQYPVEIPGVSNMAFLHAAFNATSKHHGAPEMPAEKFAEFVKEKSKFVEMDPAFLDRAVNSGFSGGEKKKNEILQMAVLSPRLAILDETDSGLDIDALRIVASGINKLRTPDRAILLITHYQRLLDYVVPDHIHVLVDGRIVKSGGKELADQLEREGYNAFQH